MKRLFSRAKDRSLALVLKQIITRTYGEYLDMVEVRIDTENKTLTLHALLKGEKESVEIQAQDYVLTSGPGGASVTLGRVSASRQWLDALLDHYVSGKSFALPSEIPAGLLEKII